MSKHNAIVWDFGAQLPLGQIARRLRLEEREHLAILYANVRESIGEVLNPDTPQVVNQIDPENPDLLLVDPCLLFNDPETGDLSPVSEDFCGFTSFGQSIWEATGKIPVTFLEAEVRDRFPHKKLVWIPGGHYDHGDLFAKESYFYNRGEFYLADDPYTVEEPRFFQVATDVCLFQYIDHCESISEAVFSIGCQDVRNVLREYFLDDDTRILLRDAFDWQAIDSLQQQFWFIFFAMTEIHPSGEWDEDIILCSVVQWLEWKYNAKHVGFSLIQFESDRIDFKVKMLRSSDKEGEMVELSVTDSLRRVECL